MTRPNQSHGSIAPEHRAIDGGFTCDDCGAERVTPRECEECGRKDTDVSETRVHGRVWTLCPGCSRSVVGRGSA